MNNNSVLIITGSINDFEHGNIYDLLKVHLKICFYEKSFWLSIKLKLNLLESYIYGMLQKKRAKDKLAQDVQTFLTSKHNTHGINLTEVSLATLLDKECITYESIALSEIIFETAKAKKLLKKHNVLFISTTLVHDLSELSIILKKAKNKNNKIVIGGALTGSLCNYWDGDPRVDIMAIGYGELLMPNLATWIKSNFTQLTPPKDGKIVHAKHSIFLYSGLPKSKNLDFIDAPDWYAYANKIGYKIDYIYYESVRGCPYRCTFCNYPYLFADTKFRYKSAPKIAADWLKYYQELKPSFIVALDSLFTIPRSRAIELCDILISHNLKMNWICYARANDLCDEALVIKMKQAGLAQVHVGLESGNQQVLDNMNKKVKVEQNVLGIEMCRKHGVTTIATVIVGFPGETVASVQETYEMLSRARPDFCFVALFSTRVQDVPILSEENKRKHGLATLFSQHSMSPYWKHNTMNCHEGAQHARALSHKLITNRVTLDPVMFINNMLNYQPSLKDELLDFQYQAITRASSTNIFFNLLHKFVDRRLYVSIEKWLLTKTIPLRRTPFVQ